MPGKTLLPKTFEQVIQSRRSVRDFSNEVPGPDALDKITASALYAPYGGATGIPLHEIRRIFVFSRDSVKMKIARELLLSQIKKNSAKINVLLFLFPFLKKKIKPFADRLKAISRQGIPALSQAPYYVVVAEKKGFPPVEKQSLAHALQNMWLTATSLGLGFQLISATGIMSKNRRFLQLLGLPEGGYALDGCAIGFASKSPELVKTFDLDKFVTRIESNRVA
jgi:nitroreductase